MSRQRCLKKSEIEQRHIALSWQKARHPKKKDCQLKIVCLSKSISIGVFLWIRMMGRRIFVSINSTSTSSFLRSGSKNGFVACMRFTLINFAAKSRFLTLYTLYKGCFLNWRESVVYILLW